ncbi:uncharacterized protein LOC134260847 [Saccostrea cucullata]|uniref:uncharacterized protein LOC134260847 n=1 Tax=Saccostrea cuccullata TaxID=36930 RepID=UPI002ED2C660
MQQFLVISYSDISSGEACELEYENVSSDEEELEKMVTDPNPEDRDILSVSSSILEDIMREDPAVNIDDFLCGDQNDFEFRGEDFEEFMEDDETSVPTEDSDMDTTNETGSTSETTVISLTLIKTETVYPDGTSEVVRNTTIAHSRNMDPTNVNFADIAMEIITEVPNHFNHRDVRVVNSTL